MNNKFTFNDEPILATTVSKETNTSKINEKTTSTNEMNFETLISSLHFEKDPDYDEKIRELYKKNHDYLTPIQRKVIRLSYGIDDNINRTFDEIGRIFNVSRERVRQVQAKALRNLRKPELRKRRPTLDI